MKKLVLFIICAALIATFASCNYVSDGTTNYHRVDSSYSAYTSSSTASYYTSSRYSTSSTFTSSVVSIVESSKPEEKTVKVIDFSDMSEKEIKKWCKKNNVEYDIVYQYSDEIPEGKYIGQVYDEGEEIYEGYTIDIYYSLGKEPTKEYLNALETAKDYSEYMHMSKKGIYNQLVSEYGEGFEPDAAQYAIDHLVADYKANALETAKDYQDTMHMSKNAIYEQLISEYGEQFTADEAQYAIDHLDD